MNCCVCQSETTIASGGAVLNGNVFCASCFTKRETPKLDRDRFLERIADALEKALPLLEAIAERGSIRKGDGGALCLGCSQPRAAHRSDGPTLIPTAKGEIRCPGFV